MDNSLKNIYEKLRLIRSEIHVPKCRYNKFADFNYRSCADILAAAKPVVEMHNCLLLMEEEIEVINERYYVKAIEKLIDLDSSEMYCAIARAQEEDKKPQMDKSQTTGSASSYAHKYALSNLFLINDEIDPDSMDNTQKHSQKTNVPKPQNPYITKEDIKTITSVLTKKFGSCECQEAKDNMTQIYAKFGVSKAGELKHAWLNDVIKAIESEPF